MACSSLQLDDVKINKLSFRWSRSDIGPCPLTVGGPLTLYQSYSTVDTEKVCLVGGIIVEPVSAAAPTNHEILGCQCGAEHGISEKLNWPNVLRQPCTTISWLCFKRARKKNNLLIQEQRACVQLEVTRRLIEGAASIVERIFMIITATDS
jgi:hypothetical protein